MNLEYVKQLQLEIRELKAQEQLFLEERSKIISYLDNLGATPDKVIVGPFNYIKYRVEELLRK